MVGGGGGSGKGHKQATPGQIANLRRRLTDLEATNANVVRYRWYTQDRVLHRFITARNGNVDVALKMLLEHLEWRISYKLDTILDEDLSHARVSHEFYWSGFDREGRPCLVFRACEHKKSDSDGVGATVGEKVRYYCQLLERGFRDYAPAHKFCLILDCRGAGTNVMDRKLFKVATPIIENNFPETQHATYVLPCSGIITMAWKVISSFIDPGTADKIRLVKDFDDPSLVDAFTPETLKAFITVNPSIAPPQPYVAPDPLANPPPPSKSSTSILSTTTTNINNNGTARSGSAVYRNNSLPSSGVCTSEGAATSIRFSAATLPSAANLPSAASIPTPFHPFPNGREVGSGSGLEGENNSVLSSYSSLGGGAANGSTAAQNRQQQGIPPQHPLPSAATPAAFPGAIPGAAASATAAAPANRGGAVANHHNRSSSSVLLPPPSPGGSTVFCGAAPSPSGSQMPSFPGRSEEGGGSTMTMQAKLSPAGAAAAAQRRTGAAAAAAAAATGVAPPSPSGSGQPPHHPAAPPSPAGDSLYAISMSGGTEGYGGGSRVSGEDGRGGGAANSGDMVEEGLLAKPATTSGGEVSGGLNGLDGGNVGASLPSPSVAVAAAAGRTIAAAPPAPAAVAPSREGGAAAATSGGLGAARGTHGEAVVQQRAGSKTIELTERTGVLYKRRDTLRGRYAYRQKQAVLRFPPPEAASLSSLRRASRSGMASPSLPPPPTLTLMKGRGRTDTEKVVSLEGAEVTLGTAMAGELYPFVISFPTMPPPPPPPGLRRSRSARNQQRRQQQQQQQQRLLPRRNTEDFMFTGVLDPTGSAGGAAGSSSRGDSGDVATGHNDSGGGGGGGEYRQLPALDFATGARGDAESKNGGVAGGRGFGARPLGWAAGVPSSSALSSPYGQWTPGNASNASSGGRGAGGTAAGAATAQRKTLHLGCDTEEQTLQWARWIADAIALHEVATEANAAVAAAAEKVEDSSNDAPWEEAAHRRQDVQVTVATAAAVSAAAAATAGRAGLPMGMATTGGSVAGGNLLSGGRATVTERGAGGDPQIVGVTLEQRQQRQDSELSYRSKYAEALDALAAVTGAGLPRPPQVPAGAETRGGAAAAGSGILVEQRGGGASSKTRMRYIWESYRRSKINDDNNNNNNNDSNSNTNLLGGASAAAPPVPLPPPREDSLRNASSMRRRGSSFLGRSKHGRSNSTSRGKAAVLGGGGGGGPSLSSTSSAAAGAMLKAGGALMSMRDSEIARLRRAYARSELSREEMKRCLRALAMQLREGEDRTGALLADREAAMFEIGLKETELAKKEALLQEGEARASAEVQQKEELVSSLQVENQALQAALERLRHDFQEERALRLKHERRSPQPPRPRSQPSTPARLGIMGRMSLASRHGTPPNTAAASGAETGRTRRVDSKSGGAGRRESSRPPPKTPTRNGDLAGPELHNHQARSTPLRGAVRGRGARPGDAPAALGTAGWDSNHGGIGSRHNYPVLSAAVGLAEEGNRGQKERGREDRQGLPWILNTDQTWVGAVRPPHEVLAHLLNDLEDLKAAHGAGRGSGSTVDLRATAPVGAPPNGAGAPEVVGAEEGPGQPGAGGGGKKEFVAETEAFVEWGRRTGELQRVPPLETVDLPGENKFTEGCLQLLSAHAAAVLHKEADQLTAREKARMAYAIGDGMYTIERLAAHLDALIAGLPTE